MDYEDAVKMKIEKQGNPKAHPFQPSFFIQQNYEIHKLLFWSYKKKVDKVVIPTGLCKLCNKLKIQHD